MIEGLRIRKPSPALVVASVSLFVALSGVSYAVANLPRNSVGTAQLKPNAVTSPKVRDGSLKQNDFAPGQLPVGAQGLAGPPGPRGETGATGNEGAQGAQGPQGPAGASGPVGVVLPYAGSEAPPGWLIADGSAVDRKEYPELFEVIGETYGAGDGEATFNLPDMRGRIPVSVGGALGTLGANEGAAAALEARCTHTRVSPTFIRSTALSRGRLAHWDDIDERGS